MTTLTQAQKLIKEVEQLNKGDATLLNRFDAMYKKIKNEIKETSINLSNIDYIRSLSNANTELNRNRNRLFGKA